MKPQPKQSKASIRNPCECGCGGYPKRLGSRYLPGHDLRKAYQDQKKMNPPRGLPRGGFIFSSRGIFLVETKTYSKSSRGRGDVEFDGERLRVNGHVPKRDPIKQVRALSRWLRDLLLESTGRWLTPVLIILRAVTAMVVPSSIVWTVFTITSPTTVWERNFPTR